jgi:hypothetical protein
MRCRPSELMGLKNTWDAYCFDSAVATFGIHVQNELDSVEGKTEKEKDRKRDAVLRRYIPELAKARKFADPGKR